MTHEQLWNEWVEEFDVFISYARKDNEGEPKMVTAFVARLEDDFRQFSPAVPLKVFFDKKSILEGQYWQDVLRKGLRQSKVMIAFLSEAYFLSEWCRKEWEEYLLVEQSRTYPGEALMPIFIVAPSDLGKVIPAGARDWWNDVTRRNAVVEIVDYWPRGREALQEAIVAERLRRLQHNIRDRVEHGRALAKAPRDIRGRNPNFVGRLKELAAVREALSRHDMVGLCAVNGVGGIGKSSVAREYAYRFRQEYLGGQFEIDLSTINNITGIQTQLVRLARDYLKAEIPYTLPEPEQFTRARDAFQNLPPGEKVLLLLDNLNESAAGLIGQANRRLLPSAEKADYLITTRAEPRVLGGIDAVSLDVLRPDEALDLLFRYRAFARRLDDPAYLAARAGTYQLTEGEDYADDAEWKAALALVNRLGRHSLAVALVGAYLGSYPDLSYRQFAADLATHGIGLALDAVGSDDKVKALIQHPATLIGPLFEQSVVRLTPLALRVLEYAAFLPPDLIPLAWLKALVTSDLEMGTELKPKPFAPPPWEETLRTLDGLDYLKGQPYARMHRVVQEVVRRWMAEAECGTRYQRVLAWIENWAMTVRNSQTVFDDLREVETVLAFTRAQSKSREHLVGRIAMSLVHSDANLGRLGVAIEMATLADVILRAVVAIDPHSAEKQRDLSIAFDDLGDVSVLSGDLHAARMYFEDGLKIRLQLARDDPHSTIWQSDLSCSFERLGDVSVVSGDLQSARSYFEDSLKIRRQLAQDDPYSAQKQRELSISLERLGNVSMSSGDLQAAHSYFEEDLKISRQLAQNDPHSAQKQRGLSVSLEKLGNVNVSSGALHSGRSYFEECLRIRQQLAQEDPHSAEKQRDLSISLEKLGKVIMEMGDLQFASGYFKEALKISRQLAQDDPHSAQKQRDLSISISTLGDVIKATGDLNSAKAYFEEVLKMSRQLAQNDPHSAEKQRDLSISLGRLGNVIMASGDLQSARHYFEEDLKISRQLAHNDPHSAQKQRDLSTSLGRLGDVSMKMGDLRCAWGYFEEGLKVSLKLAQDDPHSAEKQRGLSYSCKKMAQLLLKSEHWREALPLLEGSLAIDEQLSAMDPTNATWQQDVDITGSSVNNEPLRQLATLQANLFPG